jgi:hypothetical protein
LGFVVVAGPGPPLPHGSGAQGQVASRLEQFRPVLGSESGSLSSDLGCLVQFPAFAQQAGEVLGGLVEAVAT